MLNALSNHSNSMLNMCRPRVTSKNVFLKAKKFLISSNFSLHLKNKECSFYFELIVSMFYELKARGEQLLIELSVFR